MVTNKPTLYSSFARAHLLFAWDIVAATIGLCIYKLCWKTWKEVFERETGLGYDLIMGKIDASDAWWTRLFTLHNCEKLSCLQLYYVLTIGCPHVGMSQGINL